VIAIFVYDHNLTK